MLPNAGKNLKANLASSPWRQIFIKSSVPVSPLGMHISSSLSINSYEA